MHADQSKSCACPHHFIIPFLVFVVGIVFLLNNLGYLPNNSFSIIWPSLIALAGVQLMISRRCKCHDDHGHCHHCHHCMHDSNGNPVQK
jgi:hypothetical protein